MSCKGRLGLCFTNLEMMFEQHINPSFTGIIENELCKWCKITILLCSTGLV